MWDGDHLGWATAIGPTCFATAKHVISRRSLLELRLRDMNTGVAYAVKAIAADDDSSDVAFVLIDGEVSKWAVAGYPGGHPTRQFTGPPAPGDSGGPCYSTTGFLIGVLSWRGKAGGMFSYERTCSVFPGTRPTEVIQNDEETAFAHWRSAVPDFLTLLSRRTAALGATPGAFSDVGKDVLRRMIDEHAKTKHPVWIQVGNRSPRPADTRDVDLYWVREKVVADKPTVKWSMYLVTHTSKKGKKTRKYLNLGDTRDSGRYQKLNLDMGHKVAAVEYWNNGWAGAKNKAFHTAGYKLWKKFGLDAKQTIHDFMNDPANYEFEYYSANRQRVGETRQQYAVPKGWLFVKQGSRFVLVTEADYMANKDLYDLYDHATKRVSFVVDAFVEWFKAGKPLGEFTLKSLKQRINALNNKLKAAKAAKAAKNDAEQKRNDAEEKSVKKELENCSQRTFERRHTVGHVQRSLVEALYCKHVCVRNKEVWSRARLDDCFAQEGDAVTATSAVKKFAKKLGLTPKFLKYAPLSKDDLSAASYTLFDQLVNACYGKFVQKQSAVTSN